MRTMVDLFAGCGGMSLGMEQAGFTPVAFSEINHDAAETYMANRLGCGIMRYGDTRDVDTDKIKREYGDIDIVTGGPPCQGFSTIGMRRSFDVEKKDLPYNHLWRSMVDVIGRLNPRAFVFENVRGILSGKWDGSGKKGDIWRDVHGGFVESHGHRYSIEWGLLHSKMYGVPQNRPRVIMVGIRRDADWNGGLLPPPCEGKEWVHPEDLLGDIVDPEQENGARETVEYPSEARTEIQRELHDAGTLTDHVYSRHSPDIVKKYRHMIDHNGEIPEEYKTRKFFQKVLPRRWGDDGPNLTLTSNNADFVHYSQPRNLTVREWARFQTFPDSYVFRGTAQTGGRRRAGDPARGLWTREVPKYTQIGNAVPVRLARAIGRHIITHI